MYGLKGHIEPVSTKDDASAYCPAIEYNCCTEDDEQMAMRLWQTQNQKRIEEYYETYLLTVKYLLGYSTEIGKIAERIKSDSGFGDRKCVARADKYLEMNFNPHLTREVFKSLIGGLEEIARLRKGFYCGLCDAQTLQDIHYHKFNPFVDSKFALSQSFCRQLVSGTIQAAYFQTFYLKRYLETAADMINCVNNQSVDMDYEIGFIKEKQIKNCYYYQQRYFFYFCEGYCETFNMSKSTSVVEGSLPQMRKFYEMFKREKERLFESPGNNELMGSPSWEEEYIDQRIGHYANETIFFPPVDASAELQEFVIDVQSEGGVDPFFSAKGAEFGIYLAGVGNLFSGVISVLFLMVMMW